ncbi:MAG TPA: hypothetical protein VFI13_04965 [Gemmatimonadales bacterium]|nr:hypothetical protein [Gemmatimonadales bacterium]
MMQIRTLLAAAGAFALAACNDGSGPMATSQVAFAVSTQSAASASAPGMMGASEVFTDSAGNSLSIDSVSVVVRKLELEGSAAACPSTGEDSASADVTIGGTVQLSDSMEHEGGDECGEVKAGPFLVDLPLGAGASRQFTVTVDTGTYTRVKIQIHTPDGANDVAFLQQHPEYAGVSLRVVGTFNDAPFVYTTGVTDVQEVMFTTPLVVGTSPTAFTLSVDLAGWFVGSTGSLIDPSTATGVTANALQVRHNILLSFHAFQDEDHDGADDHTEGGMH